MITNHELGKSFVTKYFAITQVRFKISCSPVSSKFCCFSEEKITFNDSVGLFVAFHSWIKLSLYQAAFTLEMKSTGSNEKRTKQLVVDKH